MNYTALHNEEESIDVINTDTGTILAPHLNRRQANSLIRTLHHHQPGTPEQSETIVDDWASAHLN